jgi:transposase-like protein
LTVWFTACWMFATQKDGVSAQSLQRALGIGSYQTAWAMLHRLRSVLVRPGRERLNGRVEVDETYMGGPEPGVRGRGGRKKVLVGVAVEVHRPKGLGRCRVQPLTDLSAATLHSFVKAHVEPSATVVTDGWPAYSGIAQYGFTHEVVNQTAMKRRGEDPYALLPGVHRVASLAKRWVIGTHQGSVGPDHLEAYLNEFVFRFNRRASQSRGLVFHRLMQLAVGHEPVRYQQLLAEPRTTTRTPPGKGGWGQPQSLDRPPAGRPWRAA